MIPDLQLIREASGAATPGPWRDVSNEPDDPIGEEAGIVKAPAVRQQFNSGSGRTYMGYGSEDVIVGNGWHDGEHLLLRAADAAFIATVSPDIALALVERIEGLERALRAELAALERHSRGGTHWDGCEKDHPRCAAVKRINEALAGAQSGKGEGQ